MVDKRITMFRKNKDDDNPQADESVTAGAGYEKPLVDVGHIEAMGKEVVSAMQSLRELLDARAAAVEACRSALEDYHGKIGQEWETLNRQETELCGQLEQREADLSQREQHLQEMETSHEELERRLTEQQRNVGEQTAAFDQQREAISTRESELSDLAASLEQKQRELDQQQAGIATDRQEWDARLRELNVARDSLGALQSQLEQELSRAADQKSELLSKYGAGTEAGDGTSVDGDLPSPAELNARESIERFHKLCRDAKRRAIGAG